MQVSNRIYIVLPIVRPSFPGPTAGIVAVITLLKLHNHFDLMLTAATNPACRPGIPTGAKAPIPGR